MPAARTAHRLARLTALVLTTTLLLATLGAGSAEAVNRSEGRMRRRINQERDERNIRRVRMPTDLVTIARRHTRRMIRKGDLYHNPNLRGDLSGQSHSTYGENVGRGNTVGSLHRLFMRSRPHRRNIISGRYDRMGVGAIRADGRLWVTVVFVG